MKNHIILPVLSIAGGVIAFILRFAQNQTGFSPDSFLPIPGNLPARLLLLVLAGFVLGLFFLTRKYPPQSTDPLSFRETFSVQGEIAPLVAGLILLTLSGALELWFVRNSLPLPSAGTPPFYRGAVLLGVLTLFSSICLLPCVLTASVGKRSSFHHAPRAELLLMPVLALVVRLVLVYRIRSVNPSLEAYAVELLALVCAIWSFLSLSAFGFHDGSPRTFPFWSACTVILCLATLADKHDLSDIAFYSGCVLIQLGFLLSFRPNPSRAKAYHSVYCKE